MRSCPVCSRRLRKAEPDCLVCAEAARVAERRLAQRRSGLDRRHPEDTQEVIEERRRAIVAELFAPRRK